MGLFLLGLTILVVGYFTYGKFVEKILKPDRRETPAIRSADGVDFLVLPHWKNMLIQLLNIAGTGPVIGVIIGIKFGVIAFLIIPIGNVIGGAVHDFVAGMMSLRNNGANLPRLIQMTTSQSFYRIFSAFMVFLLLLVVAVFINIPAQLIDGGFDMNGQLFWPAVGLIFLYYIVATLFPVDKIIGSVYPIFGALLLLGTIAIFGALLWHTGRNPDLLIESAAFQAAKFTPEKFQPIIPMLFVTIACGILSGFHATQSPIIARTMAKENQACSSFYGMMIVEGLIAMVWAAGALAIYNLFPEMLSVQATAVLSKITSYFLGSWVGRLTVLSVIILAVTSGDTAMRSLRLSLAEMLNLKQQKFSNRLLLCLPLVAVVSLLLWWSNQSAASFGKLWNYFAWGNQVLAASTLTAVSIWLAAQKKPYWITLLPGMFITFVVATYIFWTSPAHKGAIGFGLELPHAYIAALFITLLFAVLAIYRGRELTGSFTDGGVYCGKELPADKEAEEELVVHD